uniref:Uncharacterized protein n=1 Tax=Sphenodon punctatus TaxID=8508 RepID=A0A8D0L2V2_SPHPU
MRLFPPHLNEGLLLGAALEVVPTLLHLLSGALPAGDAIDLGSDALPDPPALGHRHPTALRPVQLGVVGPHLLDEDLVLFVGETRFPQPGDLLAVPGHSAWRPAAGRGAAAQGRGLCPTSPP